jgi:hypothetical protein
MKQPLEGIHDEVLDAAEFLLSAMHATVYISTVLVTPS